MAGNRRRPRNSWLRRGGRLLLDTVLPRVCPGCGDELEGGRWICGGCRRGFRPVAATNLCLACRREFRARRGREAGLGCVVPGHGPLLGAAAFWMEPPLDAVVHAFKYSGREDLARALARLVAARIPAPAGCSGILAAPLHPARRRERGYDQAELLGRAIGERWGVPFVPGVLVRSRRTEVQARLAEADRPANVAGAFRVEQPAWVSGRSWTLVDDVLTTGATLGAAIEALAVSGAARVAPVALALA